MKAFPNIQLTVSEMGQVRAINEVNAGMDLRDYFASHAMQAIIANSDKKSISVEEVSLWVGNYAYTVADAMMEARK